MPAKKGTMPPNAGKGKPKGSKNRIPVAVKMMVEEALTNLGGVQYLEEMAVKEPKAFMALVGKIIPAKVEAELTVLDPDNLLNRLNEGRQRIADARVIDHEPGEVARRLTATTEEDYDTEHTH